MLRVIALGAMVAMIFIGASEAQRPLKPHLELSVRPHATNPGQTVVASAQLTRIAGDPEYACPEVRWSWGDGSDSTSGGECPSPETGPVTARQFSSEHVYNDAGEYHIEVSVLPKKAATMKATATVAVKRDKPYLGVYSPVRRPSPGPD